MKRFCRDLFNTMHSLYSCLVVVLARLFVTGFGRKCPSLCTMIEIVFWSLHYSCLLHHLLGPFFDSYPSQYPNILFLTCLLMRKRKSGDRRTSTGPSMRTGERDRQLRPLLTRILIPSLACQGLCRIYIKSST